MKDYKLLTEIVLAIFFYSIIFALICVWLETFLPQKWKDKAKGWYKLALMWWDEKVVRFFQDKTPNWVKWVLLPSYRDKKEYVIYYVDRQSKMYLMFLGKVEGQGTFTRSHHKASAWSRSDKDEVIKRFRRSKTPHEIHYEVYR